MDVDDKNAFSYGALFIERSANLPYVKIWIGSDSKRSWNSENVSQRTQSRFATGRLIATIDDSYRIHIPMTFRRKTDLFKAAVWVVRGKEIEIWNEQKWELENSVYLQNKSIFLPQRELTIQVRQLLRTRNVTPPEAEIKIDTRGRFTIPSYFMRSLSEQVIIRPSLDSCLSVFSYDQWCLFVKQKLSGISNPDKLRLYNRALFSTAYRTKLEPDGRLAIPTPLQEYAKTGNQVTILEGSYCLYLWDSKTWNNLTSFD
jgi:MraZ protein